MPDNTEPTTWERFQSKMASLGIDPFGSPVDEDDPRFEEMQAVLAEFGGVVPLPPLPLNWEGRRPVDYDGTVAGIGRWLDFERRQIIAKGIFPGAGQMSLAHLNEMIRNAYRAFAHLQLPDPPKRKGRATEIAVAKERIEDLAEFVQFKLKSGWQCPTTDKPKHGKIETDRWADLGIGIGVGKYYAFPKCPELGQRVRLMDAIEILLVGDRWPKVLECLAVSRDGKTAAKAELVQRLGYLKKGDIPEDFARDQQLTVANNAMNKLRNTMGDLGRELRGFVTTRDPTTIFQVNGDDYLAAFTTRHLLRDDDGNYSFGEAR